MSDEPARMDNEIIDETPSDDDTPEEPTEKERKNSENYYTRSRISDASSGGLGASSMRYARVHSTESPPTVTFQDHSSVGSLGSAEFDENWQDEGPSPGPSNCYVGDGNQKTLRSFYPFKMFHSLMPKKKRPDNSPWDFRAFCVPTSDPSSDFSYGQEDTSTEDSEMSSLFPPARFDDNDGREKE